MGRASGWLGPAQRLLERQARECVEQGYLLLPVVLQQRAAGHYEAAAGTATRAAEIGERFGDADRLALAVHEQGHALLGQGRVVEGLGLMDEAIVAVTAGEVAFTGRCLVHRAELMHLRGAWPDALHEARRAGQRCAQTGNRLAAAQAFYRQGEVHRLRGQFAAAEEAYREASRCGREPQPGLALLRLPQGQGDAAAAAIRRVAEEITGPLQRARLLPAYVEIMLAVGDVTVAHTACRELEEIAAVYENDMLGATAGHARGAVDLAEGDARAALVALRQAGQAWQQLDAPYEAARAGARGPGV